MPRSPFYDGPDTRRATWLEPRIKGELSYNEMMEGGSALGFGLLDGFFSPEIRLQSWLCTWKSIGNVIVGMHRQGYDVQLTQYDERGWRATFFVTGMEHSTTSVTASAWETTPWRAVQRAAWEALTKQTVS